MFPFLFEFEQPNDAVFHDTGVERIQDELPPLFGKNKLSLPEQIEMMRNRGFADLEVLGNRAGGEVAGPEQFENPAPRGVIECFEQRIHNLDN